MQVSRSAMASVVYSASLVQGELIMAAKKRAKKSSGRELINTGSDKRYVRRDSGGKFSESDDVGRSLSQDRRRKAKTAAKSGQGDKGD
jgi:hypothetical protein